MLVFFMTIFFCGGFRGHRKAAGDCMTDSTRFHNMDIPADLFRGCPLPPTLQSSIMSFIKSATLPTSERQGGFSAVEGGSVGLFSPREIVGRPTVSLPAEQKQAGHCNSLPLVFNASSFHLCRCARRMPLLSRLKISKINDLFKRVLLSAIIKGKKSVWGPEATAHNEIFLPS